MATEPLKSLADQRLVIVTGKGGTGKTTVAAALAVAASRAGRRVLIAEVGRREEVPNRIAPGQPPVGYAGRELLPGLTAIHIDPFEALAEYLGLQLHVRGLVDLALRNRGFRQLLEAAPGWRELITLGKVWHLSEQRRPDGTPRYELIVVDAPATGHGMTFLDVPRVAAGAVRAGPLRNHAHLVEDLIHDPSRSLLLPVALAEELPARETVELVTRARDSIDIAVDRVVVNAVAESPFPQGQAELHRTLAAIPTSTDLGDLPSPSALSACASTLASRYAINRRYLREIAELCALPVVPLQYCAGGVAGAEQLAALGAPLLSA